MSDPYVRTIGHVLDVHGVPLTVGVDYDTVVIGSQRIDSYEAGEFAQLYVSACMQAAAQSAGSITAAQNAELNAAADEMCLADCGAPVHDQACKPQPGRTLSQ